MHTEPYITSTLRILHNDYSPFDVGVILNELLAFLQKYRIMHRGEQLRIRQCIQPEHGLTLLRCAQGLAARAVRYNHPDDVALGLLAVALEGVRADCREAVVALCLVHHSSRRIGVDPEPLFHEAVAHGTATAREFMLSYLRDGSKDIRAMGLAEGWGSDGFDYHVINI
jgi:hypothetical protein